MIVVTGRVHVQPVHRDAFAAVATEMCRRSRDDAGCIGYRVYEDLEQPDHYVIVEEWADDAALQAHFTQPHTGAFMGQLPELLAAAPDALFHTVDVSRRLQPGVGLVEV